MPLTFHLSFSWKIEGNDTLHLSVDHFWEVFPQGYYHWPINFPLRQWIDHRFTLQEENSVLFCFNVHHSQRDSNVGQYRRPQLPISVMFAWCVTDNTIVLSHSKYDVNPKSSHLVLRNNALILRSKLHRITQFVSSCIQHLLIHSTRYLLVQF